MHCRVVSSIPGLHPLQATTLWFDSCLPGSLFSYKGSRPPKDQAGEVNGTPFLILEGLEERKGNDLITMIRSHLRSIQGSLERGPPLDHHHGWGFWSPEGWPKARVLKKSDACLVTFGERHLSAVAFV